MTSTTATVTHRDRVLRDFLVSGLLANVQKDANTAIKALADIDQEFAAAESFSDPVAHFYSALKQLKDDHRRGTSAATPTTFDSIAQQEQLWSENLESLFSGEEAYGRVFDWVQLHSAFLNLPWKPAKRDDSKDPDVAPYWRISYLNFIRDIVDWLTSPEKITLSLKKTEPYSSFLRDFQKYLEGFFAKARPLYDVETLKSEDALAFYQAWESGTLPGYESIIQQSAVSNRELYCMACSHQFTNPSVFKAHLPGKKHKRNAKNLESSNQDTPSIPSSVQQIQSIAAQEHLIKSYLSVLSDVHQDTFQRVEARAMLTEDEREAMLLEDAGAVPEYTEDKGQEDGQDGDDDVDEDRIYNPLKLPLGWDGKPIPYWLYKLHGLGVEYECEICGGYIYFGRKPFDEHFTQYRHGWGLKCLGLTNQKAFRGITKIEDVLALNAKIIQESSAAAGGGTAEEEMEDSEGNVYSRKTYEDLQRQGLI